MNFIKTYLLVGAEWGSADFENHVVAVIDREAILVSYNESQDQTRFTTALVKCQFTSD